MADKQKGKVGSTPRNVSADPPDSVEESPAASDTPSGHALKVAGQDQEKYEKAKAARRWGYDS